MQWKEGGTEREAAHRAHLNDICSARKQAVSLNPMSARSRVLENTGESQAQAPSQEASPPRGQEKRLY